MTAQTLPNNPQTPDNKTTAGSYFVSNYPPYSFWNKEDVEDVFRIIETPPAADTPLGLYFHIPFCRKRCHFCYFKVYTDKRSADIRAYIGALKKEMSMYAGKPVFGGRKPSFIYFGGGTPSYLSARQLRDLTDGLKAELTWDEAREVAFECEPGTLSGDKLDVLREIGVTRLSLGVENFDDSILEINGRAHRSPEIYKTYEYARSLGFPQINIDLIAGMINETGENWRRNIEKVIELSPQIVTIYQMEVPFNTTIYQSMKAEGKIEAPVADWETKRRWVREAFEMLEANGYNVSSAYSAVKKDVDAEFLYRDWLWRGADLIGMGVSSFSHLQGTHFQNEKDFVPYMESIDEGRFPIRRALTVDNEERMIREFILQLKKGEIATRYFREKYQTDVLERFADPLNRIEEMGYLTGKSDSLRLNRDGLLRVDSLLPNFYLPKHQGARYT